uniref:Uncharacterized protein n=1 Tax=Knipowitschia caucasica TaxID=637954 RepID=A0AAV2KLM6_KNICA
MIMGTKGLIEPFNWPLGLLRRPPLGLLRRPPLGLLRRPPLGLLRRPPLGLLHQPPLGLLRRPPLGLRLQVPPLKYDVQQDQLLDSTQTPSTCPVLPIVRRP